MIYTLVSFNKYYVFPMRVSKILQHYFIKAAIIGLYAVFFATQLFSITLEIGSTSSAVRFFGNHALHAGTATVNIENKTSVTEKNAVGFRLNKRFHPTEWFFTHTPLAQAVGIDVTAIEQKAPFRETLLPSTILLFELFRGPPETA